jgi:peptidoglycan/LPS O-acetylase OafA/YrhL
MAFACFVRVRDTPGIVQAVNRETSLYLDAWRLFAALTVFVGHVSGQRFTGGFLWQFAPFMGEAVAVFLVLSGFVIGYATDRGPGTAQSYAVSRLARVYSVALPALIVTFTLDSIGRLYRPELYAASWGYVADGQFWQFVSGLLFFNQIWGLDLPQGSDLPYWTLSYEVWYYVIFGLATFAPRRLRVGSILLALVFVGPAIASMLPLWLLGLFGYRLCAARPIPRVTGWIVFAGSLLIWVIYEIWGRGHLEALVTVPAIFRRPSLIEDYIVGALFISNILGFHAISQAFGGIVARVQKPVRWAAGATFTIYLLHLPVAQFLITQVPGSPTSWTTRAIVLGGTLLILFALAEATERRKDPWKRAFDTLLARARSSQPAV